MTRYLLFTILGLPIGYFMVGLVPKNSWLLDIIGMALLIGGACLYLSNTRLAGLLSTIGLALGAHVIFSGWYNTLMFDLDERLGLWSARMIVFGVLLSVVYIVLFGLAIHASWSGKPFRNKLDRYQLRPLVKAVLVLIPVVVVVSTVGVMILR